MYIMREITGGLWKHRARNKEEMQIKYVKVKSVVDKTFVR